MRLLHGGVEAREIGSRVSRIVDSDLHTTALEVEALAGGHHIQPRLADTVLGRRDGVGLVGGVAAVGNGPQVARDVQQALVLLAGRQLHHQQRLEGLADGVRRDEVRLQRLAQRRHGHVPVVVPHHGRVVDQDVDPARDRVHRLRHPLDRLRARDVERKHREGVLVLRHQGRCCRFPSGPVAGA